MQLPVRARSNDAKSDHSEEEGEGQGSYESMPRSFEKSQKKKKERLPIKTQEGILRHVEVDSEEEEEEEEEESGGSEGEDEMERGGGDDGTHSKEGDKEGDESNKPLPTKAEQRQQILEAKEELAQIGLSLNEDPEENVRPLPSPHHSQLTPANLSQSPTEPSLPPLPRIFPLPPPHH